MVHVAKRLSALLMALLLAFILLTAQTERPGQVPQVPAELAWITLFANEVRINPQGHWEAALKQGIVMIYVPAGEFTMGSPRSEVGREPDEGPVHRVFTKGIWIGKYEVTRALWHAVMGGDAIEPSERDLPQGDVSYRDIQAFLRALNLGSGLDYRLPTEAEWEKCCRGGGPSSQYGPIDEIAWNIANSGGKIHPVGTKRPNGFGLFDMLGNIWEWCSDWYSSGYYGTSPLLNPTGPSQGKRRVCRGGGFAHGGGYLRSAHRNSQEPAKSRPYLGFRLVLDSPL
jgi:formylglycine-generating enzyme required for sulfatase activity